MEGARDHVFLPCWPSPSPSANPLLTPPTPSSPLSNGRVMAVSACRRDPGEGLVDDKTASLIVFVGLIVSLVGFCYARSWYRQRRNRLEREEEQRELELRIDAEQGEKPDEEEGAEEVENRSKTPPRLQPTTPPVRVRATARP